MEYRNLGRTGVKVSPLCIGAGSFCGGEYEPFARLLGEAIDLGLNFIDTANIYGGAGRDERMIGRAVREMHNRDRLIIATKVEGPMDPNDLNARGYSRRHIIDQCEQSLRRLGTDYIDLYQLHCSRGSEMPIDEPLRALDDLVRAGKVRYLGASHFAAWQLMDMLWCAKELRLNRFVCEQAVYHPLDRTIERELVPFALTHGHAIILWSPLAGGLLGDRRGRDEMEGPLKRLTMDRRAAGFDWDVERALDHAGVVVETIKSIASDKGCTPAQFVLAWELAQPAVTAPIAGFSSREQLHQNVAAIDLEITADDRRRIDAVARPRQAIVPCNDVGGTPPLNSDWGPFNFAW